jgi:hypothetical protein
MHQSEDLVMFLFNNISLVITLSPIIGGGRTAVRVVLDSVRSTSNTGNASIEAIQDILRVPREKDKKN